MIQTSLLDYRLERCSNFAQKLIEFKGALDSLDLEAKVNDLHVSFLLLINSFEIKPVPSLQKEELEKKEAPRELEEDSGIRRIEIQGITVSVYDGLVIDVDDLHSEFARLFVNRKLESIEDQINMLWDYDSRPCDFCGQYFTKPMLETPMARIKMQDFALACHETCIPKN